MASFSHGLVRAVTFGTYKPPFRYNYTPEEQNIEYLSGMAGDAFGASVSGMNSSGSSPVLSTSGSSTILKIQRIGLALTVPTTVYSSNEVQSSSSEGASSEGAKYNFSKSPSYRNRHVARRGDMKTLARDFNTVALNGVDYAQDVDNINAGLATEAKDVLYGVEYRLDNGNIYYNDNGFLKPLEGGKYVTLSRGAYKALGALNSFGGNVEALAIKNQLGKSFSQQQLNQALDVYNKIQ